MWLLGKHSSPWRQCWQQAQYSDGTSSRRSLLQDRIFKMRLRGSRELPEDFPPCLFKVHVNKVNVWLWLSAGTNCTPPVSAISFTRLNASTSSSPLQKVTALPFGLQLRLPCDNIRLPGPLGHCLRCWSHVTQHVRDLRAPR